MRVGAVNDGENLYAAPQVIVRATPLSFIDNISFCPFAAVPDGLLIVTAVANAVNAYISSELTLGVIAVAVAVDVVLGVYFPVYECPTVTIALPVTVNVAASKVKLGWATALLGSVEKAVNTLLAAAVSIVLNPVPDVPLVPDVPAVPAVPAVPDVPLPPVPPDTDTTLPLESTPNIAVAVPGNDVVDVY